MKSLLITAITVINPLHKRKLMKNDISTIVRYHRKASGLTQNELAILAGVGKTAIFDIEKGKQTIQLNTLLKILDALNIKMVFETPLAMDVENK